MLNEAKEEIGYNINIVFHTLFELTCFVVDAHSFVFSSIDRAHIVPWIRKWSWRF